MQCFPCINAHKMKEEHIGLLIRSNNKEIPNTLKLESTIPVPCRSAICKKEFSTIYNRSKNEKLKSHTPNNKKITFIRFDSKEKAIYCSLWLIVVFHYFLLSVMPAK